MAGIPEDIINQLHNRADIVDVIGQFTPLKQRGADFWGCCPFHHEKTPSFKVNSERQAYYCFGCHVSGGVFKFIQQIQNTDFVGAVHWLADYYHIEIPETSNGFTLEESAEAAERRRFREKGQLLLEAAAAYFHNYLLNAPEAAPVRLYLKERGRNDEVIKKFRLGFAPDSWDAITKWAESNDYNKELLLATGLAITNANDQNRYYDRFRNRLIFPICNENDRVVGFSARTLEPHPKSAKYVNSPDSDFFHKGKILYGLNFARKSLRETGYALICEGQMDVIACHQAGIVQAMAAQGTAFTEEHATLLKRSINKVRLSFDGDAAGMKATLRTICLLYEAGLDVSVVSLPDGEDPDSIFRVGGAQALQQIMSSSTDAVQFVFFHACAKYDKTTPIGKKDIVSDTLDVIASIQDAIIRTAQCQWLAGELQLPEEIVTQALASRIAAREKEKERQNNWQQQRRLNDTRTAANSTPISQPAPKESIPVTSIILPDANDGAATILQYLFDLIYHYDFLANRLSATEYQKWMPDLPIARAINFIMRFHEQGEWQEGVNQIADSAFMNDPAVGQSVVSSSVTFLDPQNQTNDDEKRTAILKLHDSLDGTLIRLQAAHIDREILELNKKIGTTDIADDEKLQLASRKISLQRQRQSLREKF